MATVLAPPANHTRVEETTDQATGRIAELLTSDALTIVFQPLMELSTGNLLGVEALARVNVQPVTGPQAWFAAADAVGLLCELELCAAARALTWLPRLPPSAHLFINVSPRTLLLDALIEVIPPLARERLVLEISASTPIPSGPQLKAAMGHLRDLGVRFAIDDAGETNSDMNRIVQLQPDLIKFDGTITRNLERSASHRAIARGLLACASTIGADVVAEAVETEEELSALVDLGVRFGQGFLLGKPATLE